ncbi:neuraminidase-like domain-containing protein [Salinirubellus sp. GCM10025818]|uniref:Tc toxin subunit A-related protein n=1 Tax=Salinirubellus TaxID=2162630 RepID=UPI0030D04E2F
MNLQGRELRVRMKGPDVELLHEELQALGFTLPSSEIDEGFFGTKTRGVVEEFQERHGLERTGEVDERTAQAINAAVDSQQPERFTVSGTVRQQDGEPLPRTTIRVTDQDLRQQQQLGEVHSDERGAYEITYTAEQFARGEKERADLVVRAFDKEGEKLAVSETFFNAPPVAVVDLVVDPSDEPKLPEYERLLAELEPVLEGLQPAELTDKDVDFLAQETGADRQHITVLAAASRHAQDTNLPTESFYGWGRLDFSLELETLLEKGSEALRSALVNAIEENIVPTRLRESLDSIMDGVEQLRIEEGLLVAHEVIGRLLTEDTSKTLEGVTIHGFDLDASPEPRDLGREITDSNGLFTLLYFAPRQESAVDHEEGTEDVRRLRVHIIAKDGTELANAEISAPREQKEVVEIHAPAEEGKTVTEVAETTNVERPADLLLTLSEHNVETLADIRREGGITHLDGVDPEHPGIPTLEAHARLSTLSTDTEFNSDLIDEGLDNIADIAGHTRADFVGTNWEVLGDVGASSVRVEADVQKQFLNNLIASYRANHASGFPSALSDSIPEADLDALFPNTCSCRDCEAAVSPLAYLAELLDYTVTYLKQENDQGNAVAVTLADLTERFHQPFGDLPTACDEVEREVCQVRVCIDVLRRYLAASELPPSDSAAEARLAEEHEKYLEDAYTAILTELGTSFDEIRTARTAGPEIRLVLADRLGIPRDAVDRLFLDPDTSATNADALTEPALEQLFGLVDTTRDPLSEGAKRGDDSEQITHWNLDGVEWTRHTDPDGTIYVSLTGAPAVDGVRVELFSDPDRTALVAAGERTTATGPVTVATVDEGALLGKVDVDYVADTDTVEIIAIPYLLSARLQSLRDRWLKQDWPTDPYRDDAEAPLPIIDPDLIGPDDLREPEAGATAFDLWLKRREWVDERLDELAGPTETAVDEDGADVEMPDVAALFDRMYQPVTYDTTDVTPWADTMPPDTFSTLRDDLTQGNASDVETTAIRLHEELHLTVEAFNRLVALRDKATAWVADPRRDPVTDEEWRAFFSILVQAQKQALYTTWIDEEGDQPVAFGPELFWISLREPAVGDWPPVMPTEEPLIDPEKRDRKDLAESTVGQTAIDLLDDRHSELETIREELSDAYENDGFETLLRQALGHEQPGDSLQHDLDNLRDDLHSNDPAVAAEAQSRLEDDLHLTLEMFERLMDVRAEANDPDPANRPTTEAIEEIVALLVSARKEKHEYDDWQAKEAAEGLVYWNTLKARLARWRATTQARSEWQQALQRRSQTPHIDPDLIRANDLQDSLTGEAAELWQARREFVKTQADALEAVRDDEETTDVAAFDANFEDSVGVPATELEVLAARRDAGEDIEPRLEQLHLTNESFEYLLGIRRAAKDEAPILDEEWTSVDAILVQVRKRREFASWRRQEREHHITLGPDVFQIPEPPALEFPPPQPEPLPDWRATVSARREWEQTLQSRIDQTQSAADELHGTVSAVEEDVLLQLRDALIEASDADGLTPDARANVLSDELLIDTRADGCQLTTRAAQAGTTLQLLLWSVRTNQLQDTHPDLLLDDDDFDEAWEWLGSYEAWRAAMLVFLYPENVLLPSLRSRQTPAFRQLVTETRTNTRLTPEDACEAANAYADYFRDVCTLTLEASVVARTDAYDDGCRARSFEGDRHFVYLFATGGATDTVYYSRYDPHDETPHAQSFWTPVPGLKRGSEVVGATTYAITDEERYVYLFVRVQDAGAHQLVYIRYDLAGDEWIDKATDLEAPEDATRFSAAVKQRNRENEPPHLAIFSSGGAIYERLLNQAGTDWEDGDWDPLVGRLKAREFSELHAMIEPAPDEYYLITRGRSSQLFYRLFGERDDGMWRALTPEFNTYLGAFPWPGSEHVYAFSRQRNGTPTRYMSLQRSPSPLRRRTISTFDEDSKGFDHWLQGVTGLSLAGSVIEDSTGYSGMNLLEFFTLERDEDPHGEHADFIYPHRGRLLIEWIAGKLEDEAESGWSAWKHADDLVRRLTEPHRSLKEVLLGLFERRLNELGISNDIPDTIRFKERDTSEEMISLGGFSGLNRIVLGSGSAPSELPSRVTYHQTTGTRGQEVVAPVMMMMRPINAPGAAREELWVGPEPRTVFVRSSVDRGENSSLTPTDPHSVAPDVTEPFELTEELSSDELQVRRAQIRDAFQHNADAPASVLAYLEEAYYFVPVHLALQLQQRTQYTAALDWFRTVYDYSGTGSRRKISHYLTQESSPTTGYERAAEWWLDPLNPHSIAGTRADTYTRFTLLSVVRCLLAFADAEFTRDTAEALPRARTLYTTALELLGRPELNQERPGCDNLIGELDIEIGPELNAWTPDQVAVWDEIKVTLRRIRDRRTLEAAITGVSRELVATNNDLPARLEAARSVVVEARATQPPSPRLAQVVETEPETTKEAHGILLRDPEIATAVRELSSTARRDHLRAVADISGIGMANLEADHATPAADKIRLPWLRQREDFLMVGGTARPADGDEPEPGIPIGGNMREAPALAGIAFVAPVHAVQVARAYAPWYLPAATFSFCVPPNPVLSTLRLTAELNLYKMRTCRNIAGDERQLEPYAAPTNTETGMPTIGGSGEIVLPETITLQPTPFRYDVLIERAKRLVGLAQQLEAAFLSTLEKRDAEYFQQLKARQELGLTRAGVRLQDLRIREAEDGVELAELQRRRAEIQVDHFQDLLNEGRIANEEIALNMLWLSLSVPDSISVSASITGPSVSSSYSPSGKLQTLANIFSTMASYERRRQEWQLQRNLARQDLRIGSQQIRLAHDRARVVGQERQIAELQAGHAAETAEFLATKFTNVELYDWMSGVLEGVYRFFLQHATSMANLAENQLAFERQEVPPPIVQADYWEAPLGMGAGYGTDDDDPDRRGLTGSTRLLRDVEELDLYAFETDERKLQLTKTISLAGLAPAEFQRFRETGVLRFDTPMDLFDRDFPGHYLRLIKRVRTSVIALIPPTEGIKATLSTTGLSRVVTGTDGRFQETRVNRPPESITLSSPNSDTGLFELTPQISEKLLPFESMGVATAWEFQLPKAANQFNFDTIADVLVTIEYTALESSVYREQVIQELDDTISADRPFSFRQEFADEWYDLNHPELVDPDTGAPMVVEFQTQREDFPPNIESCTVQHVVLYFVRQEGTVLEVSADLSFISDESAGSVGGRASSVDGVISTRRGNAGSWTGMIGTPTAGTWTLDLTEPLSDGRPVSEAIKNEEIEDILFVVTYQGRTPTWPS